MHIFVPCGATSRGMDLSLGCQISILRFCGPKWHLGTSSRTVGVFNSNNIVPVFVVILESEPSRRNNVASEIETDYEASFIHDSCKTI